MRDNNLFSIPSDWEWRKLGDIGESIIGLTYSPKEVSEKGTLVLRSSNVYSNRLKYDDNVYVKKKIKEKIVVKENDILICVRNGSRRLIGKCALIKGRAVGETFGAFMSVFRSNDNLYIFHVLQSDFIKLQVNQHIGATINQITNSSLNEFAFPSPPLPQQRKIAHILSTCDAVIEQTEAAIAKYEALKQGMMKDLFTRGIDLKTGQLRPTYEAAPDLYKESVLGWIPREWEVQELGELTSKIVDGTHFTPKYTESGVPFLRVTDVQTEKIDFDRIKFISEQEHTELIKRCNPEKGDILYSKNGTIGIPKLVDWDWDFSIFVSLALIKPKSNLIKSKYLLLLLPEEVIWNQIRQRAKQGTVTNLHLEEIREFLIPLPPNKEQEAIYEKGKMINQKIQTEQSTLAKYQQLKAGLMQDLLTGKVEVEVE